MKSIDAWHVNPALMQTWGNFSLHFEGLAGWGTMYPVNGKSTDTSGHGFYLDGEYNYGPGYTKLAGWWTSGGGYGSAYGAGGDYKAQVEINQANFYPLIVAYNATSSGWGRNTTNAATATSPDIFHFGYKEQSEDMGVEADLGFHFKLLDNLTFTASFGYMWNGDAYKTLRGYRATADIQRGHPWRPGQRAGRVG